MKPLVTVVASKKTNPDFGDLSEPYGGIDSYQELGLFMTLINVPSWTAVEAILASHTNAVASITPCKPP